MTAIICIGRVCLGVLDCAPQIRFNQKISFKTLTFGAAQHLISDTSGKDIENSVKGKPNAPKREAKELKKITENKLKRPVFLSKAVKYRTERNTNSTELKSNAEVLNCGPQKDVNKKKKFKIREAISEHDLKVKINYMLKYLKKGSSVCCEITEKEGKLNKILDIFKESELKNYSMSTVESGKLFIIIFKGKLITKEETKEETKVQTKETDKCS